MFDQQMSVWDKSQLLSPWLPEWLMKVCLFASQRHWRTAIVPKARPCKTIANAASSASFPLGRLLTRPPKTPPSPKRVCKNKKYFISSPETFAGRNVEEQPIHHCFSDFHFEAAAFCGKDLLVMDMSRTMTDDSLGSPSRRKNRRRSEAD